MISFKSRPEFFDKEKRGSKSNTLRHVDMFDERFKTLLECFQLGVLPSVEIKNSVTGETFVRRLTDISFFDVLEKRKLSVDLNDIL